MMIRMVGGWVFLLVPADLGSPGQRAVKRLMLLCVLTDWHHCRRSIKGQDRQKVKNLLVSCIMIRLNVLLVEKGSLWLLGISTDTLTLCWTCKCTTQWMIIDQCDNHYTGKFWSLLKVICNGFSQNWWKVVSSCWLQYKPVCAINFDKLCCRMLISRSLVVFLVSLLFGYFRRSLSCVTSYQDALVTFWVSRRRRKMYCGHACLCVSVCLSVHGHMPTLLHGPGCPRPYAHTTARTRM